MAETRLSNFQLPYLYMGVDLGMQADHTAIALLEEQAYKETSDLYWNVTGAHPGWQSPLRIGNGQLKTIRFLNQRWGLPHLPDLHLIGLERLPLGTPYPRQVDRVLELLDTPALRGRHIFLIVDAGGAGLPVVDLFRESGLSPVPVTITGGTVVTGHYTAGINVPKRDLISAAQVMLQGGRLKVSPALQEADTLRKELESYQVKIDPRTAHDSYDARSGQHDDLVLAVSLAVWWRNHWMQDVDRACRRAWRNWQDQDRPKRRGPGSSRR